MAWAFMSTAKPEPSLRVRAMRFLARREHSRAELKRKLAPKVAQGEDIDAVLDDLARRGWLSDVRFAEQAARSKAKRFGPRRLAYYLKSRGLDEETIEAGIRNAGIDGASSLEIVWASRFRAPPADEREKMRQVRFLQGRGFEIDAIFKFFRILEEKS
jgi:regulatory protein